MRPIAFAVACLLVFSPCFALVEWSASATEGINGGAVLSSGKAIFSSLDGRIYAFGSDTGSLSWTYDTGEKITLPAMLLDANTVAAVTSGGRLVYASMLEGRGSGDFALNKIPTSFAAGAGRAFVGFNDSVVAVDAAGRTVWSYSLPAPAGPMRLSEGRLYFVSGGKLYAILATTGLARWIADTGESFLSTPVEAGGIVYAGSTDGRLYAVGSGGGNLLWSYKTDGWVMGSPAADEEGVYFGSNDGHFYAVDKYGHLLFMAPAEGGAWARPEFYSGPKGREIVFATSEGKVVSLDAKSGEGRWQFSSYGKASDLVSYAGKTLIFGTSKGKVYSLSPAVICSFDWPTQASVVGDWPVEVEGKASASAGIESVEIRLNGGRWAAANGTTDWHASVDFSGVEVGAATVECRVRDSDGRMDTQDYSYLVLLKSESAPLNKMYATAPKSAGMDERFSVEATDSRGHDLRNVTISVGGATSFGDSPFSVVLGRGGLVTISLDKPGFEPQSLVVTGRGGTDWLPIIALLLLAAAAGWFLFGKKLLAKKK